MAEGTPALKVWHPLVTTPGKTLGPGVPLASPSAGVVLSLPLSRKPSRAASRLAACGPLPRSPRQASSEETRPHSLKNADAEVLESH